MPGWVVSGQIEEKKEKVGVMDLASSTNQPVGWDGAYFATPWLVLGALVGFVQVGKLIWWKCSSKLCGGAHLARAKGKIVRRAANWDDDAGKSRLIDWVRRRWWNARGIVLLSFGLTWFSFQFWNYVEAKLAIIITWNHCFSNEVIFFLK